MAQKTQCGGTSILRRDDSSACRKSYYLGITITEICSKNKHRNAVLDESYTLPQPNRRPNRNTKSVLAFHIVKLSMLCIASVMAQFPKARKIADEP